jgi:hypothetical protein
MTTLLAEIVGGRRDRHQSAQPQPGKGRDKFRQGFHPGRFRAALARLVAYSYLNAYVQGWSVKGSLVVESAGDFFPVHGLYPLKPGGNLAGLVGLQATDEMPLEGQVVGRVHFGERLLNEILAEPALTAIGGLTNCLDWLRFADCQQSNFFRISSKSLTGGKNPFCYLGQPE